MLNTKPSMIKKGLLAALLILPLHNAQASDWSGNIGGFIGSKKLQDNAWAQHDKQKTIGVISDFRKTNWPVSIAVNLSGSGHEEKVDGQKDESLNGELQIGLRKVFEREGSPFKPYFGGGISRVKSEIKLTGQPGQGSESEKDSGIGYWLGVGSYYEMSDHFQLGVDLSYSKAKVDLSGIERNTGGLQTVFTVGYHW